MERRHYLFFALRPDPEAAERIHAFAVDLRRRLGLTGWPIPPDRLHISLTHVVTQAKLDPQTVEKAMAARLVSAGHPGRVGCPPVSSPIRRIWR